MKDLIPQSSYSTLMGRFEVNLQNYNLKVIFPMNQLIYLFHLVMSAYDFFVGVGNFAVIYANLLWAIGFCYPCAPVLDLQNIGAAVETVLTVYPERILRDEAVIDPHAYSGAGLLEGV